MIFFTGDWESWTAAVCDDTVRDMIYGSLAYWINNTPTNLPMGDLFDTKTGDYISPKFINRPVMGGVFAQLVLGMGLTVKEALEAAA